jgi:hypothetical protein
MTGNVLVYLGVVVVVIAIYIYEVKEEITASFC